MSLVREKDKTVSGRSLKVTRTYLRIGQSVSHSLRRAIFKSAASAYSATPALTSAILPLLLEGFKQIEENHLS